MGHPRPLSSFIFGLFKQTLQFYNNVCEKCPSSIRYRDSNSQPFDYESPPLTTRPGLPPTIIFFSMLHFPQSDDTKIWLNSFLLLLRHFFKKWANPDLFLFIFVLFTFQFKWQIYNLNNINWKKHRWCAWDSNPGQLDGRHRRIHWAMRHFIINLSYTQIK